MALGGRIEIEVVPDTSRFASQLRGDLAGVEDAGLGVGQAIGVALAAGAAVAAVGLKSAIDLGIQFQGVMNELQSVTNASDATMSQFSATAQKLGSDLQLPATSAADAAAIMLELAKGGLTAEQAMGAARGTILLAAAAQIDGARAAEIQSAAINQFGLEASDAGRVADTLANTANAASGGIEDIALAMKYVGPIAKGMSISIEDTATAIGLLANNGIQADNAGTALRGMLASLAAPSKQAQKGLDALGITAFDSSGNFVGLRSVIDQLSVAQGKMSEEQFTAAAAMAFGREPLAAITALAREGGPAFDQMREAVGRAGGAQDVAAAKMRGLGGAIEQLNSQLETAQLQVFDAIAKPLEDSVRFAATLIPAMGDAISSGLRTLVAVGNQVGPSLATGIVQSGSAILDAGRSIFEPFANVVLTALGQGLQLGLSLFDSYVGVLRNVVAALTPVAQGFSDVAQSALEGGGALQAVGATIGVVGSIVSTLSGVLVPIGQIVGGLVSAFAALPAPIQTVAIAMLALRFAGPLLAGLGSAFTAVTQNTGIFGRALSGLTAPVRAFGAGINQAVQNSRNFANANDEAASRANAAVASYGRISQGVAGLGRGLANSVNAVRQFGGEMRTQSALANAYGYNLTRMEAAQSAYRSSTLGAVAAARNFTDQVNQIRAGAAGAGAPISAMAASMRTLAERSPAIASMGAAFQTASTNALAFGRAAGVAAAAGAGLRALGSGLIGALGGPFGAAITAAVVGIGLWVAANQRAKAATAEHEAAVSSVSDALKQTSGVWSQQTDEALASTDQFKAAAEAMKNYGVASNDLLASITSGGPALEQYRQQLQQIIDLGTLTTVNPMTGTSATTMNQAARDAQAALDALNELASVADAGKKSYADYATAVEKAGASMVNGGEAGMALRDALIELGDASSTAEEKTNALAAALDALSGGQLSLEQAQAKLNASMSEIGKSFTDAAAGAKEAGTSLLTAEGAINTTTEAGRRLLTDTTGLARSMSDTAAAAFEQAGGMQNLGPATAAASEAATSARQSFIDAARAAGLNAEQAAALADRYGLIPSNVVTLLTAQGLDQVGQELLQLKTNFDAVPGQKTITVQGLTAEAETKLRELGFTVTRLPNGQVTVTAQDQAARDKLAAFLAFASGQVSIVSIDANPDPATGKITSTVQLGNGQTATMTYDARPDPATGKIQATVDLGNGQTAVMTLDADPATARGVINGTVVYADGSTGTIQVKANASAANTAIDNAARNRTTTITVKYHMVGQPGVPGQTGRALGAVTTPAYMAAGGMRKLSARWAEIVPPRQPRVIGDRMIGDEAFIPINGSARSRAIFEETARRMGYSVARMRAEGAITSAAVMQGIASQRATAGSNADIVSAIGGLSSRIGVVEKRVEIVQNFNVPSAERASDKAAAAMRRAGAMGIFG